MKRCFLIKSRCRLKKGGGGVGEKGRIDMGRNGASDKEMSQEGDEGGRGLAEATLPAWQITQIQQLNHNEETARGN